MEVVPPTHPWQRRGAPPHPRRTPMPPITDTRQRPIDAAGELFWERGYAATGLSDSLAVAGARGGGRDHLHPAKGERTEEARPVARAMVCMIQGALLQARAAKSEAPLDQCAATISMLLGGAELPVVVRREALARV